MAIIVHNRITRVVKPALRKEQAEFRPGRSCIGHINTIRIIVEQSGEWQSPLYLLFVDFKQDSLDREAMWTVLASYGISAKYISVIRGLYSEANCRVIHRSKMDGVFTVRSGVKQRCILSPLLFILVLDWVMKKVNRNTRGIRWTLTRQRYLQDLDFADDICLMAHRKANIETKLGVLKKYTAQIDLKINAVKIKIIRVNANTLCNLYIEDEHIEEVDKFCYLGSLITGDGSADEDIKSRIQKARQSFGMLNNIWRSIKYSRNLKLKIFKSNMLSVMLYGCETWRVTDRLIGAFQVFVNRCLRRILAIFWPDTIENEELWRISKCAQIRTQIKKKKWIGHTLRRPEGDIAREALD